MTFKELTSQSERPAALRYGFAVLVVGLAVLIRLSLQGLFSGGVPFLFFFPAIMAAGWYGGLGPGLLATGLSSTDRRLLPHAADGSFAVANLGERGPDRPVRVDRRLHLGA